MPGKRARRTEGEIVQALKQIEAGKRAPEVARDVGVSQTTLLIWQAKYGGLQPVGVRRLKELERENRDLRKLVTGLSLDKEALKAAIQKITWRR